MASRKLHGNLRGTLIYAKSRILDTHCRSAPLLSLAVIGATSLPRLKRRPPLPPPPSRAVRTELYKPAHRASAAIRSRALALSTSPGLSGGVRHSYLESPRPNCAGITVTNEEQLAEVNRLVEEVLAPQTRLADGLHPMTNLVEHRIQLTDETPIKHKLRRMTEPMLWEARNTVTKWYKEGIIEPSASDFRSAPVLVKKSDGGYRMCIDFRDLNARTVKDVYPEANMDIIFDRLRNARFISTIDL
ncbi:unnamed protein product [Trichogramma brassicae]|uniref:Reverse transcriptase domain-containing protein n=1 Tax=Trichogramma brassicae TaxID=86971 RepID=A0A6H5IK23_9HYME|nr:unnamed protein product [Trichogramma brassicae]